MNQIEDFLLRRSKEELRNAVRISAEDFQGNLPELLSEAEKRLIDWAGEYSYRYGYNVNEASFEINEANYGTEIGVGIFLECEKYNDIRGLLLTAYENANDLKKENEELINRNESLEQQIKDVEEKYGSNRGGLFDRFYEENKGTDEN